MVIFRSSFPDSIIPADADVYSFLIEGTKCAQAPKKDKVALIDATTGESRTFGQLVERIELFAAGLVKNYNFKPGDVVLVFSPNHIDYATVLFAVSRQGGITTTANPTYTVPELTYQLKDSGATIVNTVPDSLPTAMSACKEAGIPDARILLLGDSWAGAQKRIQDVFSTQIPPRYVYTREQVWNQPCYLVYSSGTTGRAKGVELTHRNIVANVIQQYDMEKMYLDWSNDRWVGVLPFYHIYGLVRVLHDATYRTIPLLIVPKFDLANFCSLVQKYRITVAALVPPIILRLAKDPIVDQYDLSSIRYIYSGAAPLSKELTLEFKVGTITWQTGYPTSWGLSETSPTATITPMDCIVPGASGKLIPSVEIKIVHPETGIELDYDQEGEIWHRGPNTMRGYWNNTKATRESIDNEGWFRTGDIGYIAANGHIYVVDRLKELIKYNGLQVAPAELEALLISHPAIADAAVIPFPDAAAGELPRAFVVAKAGKHTPTLAADLFKFVDDQVAPHKKLRGGICFVDAIEKSPSGKILRRLLRDNPGKGLIPHPTSRGGGARL
ncbi:hypothetical protein SmJEL517_g04592 [Synchytrium microbalum]|uniref:4-coumarate--CoA ligase n=1 Tax=Synchytrium microbalum TaxID=1806994 RepID=A0A507BXW1_9FUNG|nr:uncharacterized protein SmJEL517_g04592 [Synchytrium microbalum]TPX32272.1 hypothetical protein SmJEL517_g04592 [Synchytrium microbalum]